jgi:hypothetical protein
MSIIIQFPTGEPIVATSAFTDPPRMPKLGPIKQEQAVYVCELLEELRGAINSLRDFEA